MQECKLMQKVLLRDTTGCRLQYWGIYLCSNSFHNKEENFNPELLYLDISAEPMGSLPTANVAIHQLQVDIPEMAIKAFAQILALKGYEYGMHTYNLFLFQRLHRETAINVLGGGERHIHIG